MSKPRGALPELISSLGAALGQMTAKPKKRKEKRKPGTRKPPIAKGPGRSMRLTSSSETNISAPAAFGVVRRSNVKHRPFPASGTSSGPQVGRIGGIDILYSNGGVATAANAANVDPAAQGSSNANFGFFPNNIAQLARCFTRYRLTKLRIKYVPFTTTADPGQIAFAVTPENVFTLGGGPIAYVDVTSCEVNAACPIWGTTEIDALASGGLRRDWCFVDQSGSTGQAEERWESPGTFVIAFAGAVSNSIKGNFTVDWAIEFDGIAREAVFDVPSRLKRAAAFVADQGPTFKVDLNDPTAIDQLKPLLVTGSTLADVYGPKHGTSQYETMPKPETTPRQFRKVVAGALAVAEEDDPEAFEILGK